MARIRIRMNHFHFGLPDPDQFYKTDPDNNQSSKYLAKIKDNLQKKIQKSHGYYLFQKKKYYSFVWRTE